MRGPVVQFVLITESFTVAQEMNCHQAWLTCLLLSTDVGSVPLK